MNAAQNGNIFGFPNNNNGINNQNMNFNQNFMNQNMMVGNQNMMMGNPNMMMGNQNSFNNQYNNMGFNNMNNNNEINSNNTNINSNTNNEKNETSIKDCFNIHDKEEIFPRKLEIEDDIKTEEDNIRIIFELSTGPEISMYGNKKTIFKEMMRKFCKKMNLDERYLENRINIIFNGSLLRLDSYSTLEDLHCHNNTIINISDDDNVIGT